MIKLENRNILWHEIVLCEKNYASMHNFFLGGKGGGLLHKYNEMTIFKNHH